MLMIERDEAHPEVLDVIVDRWSPRSFVESAVPQGRSRRDPGSRRLGSIGIQYPAMALSLCPSRGRELGSLPLAPRRFQPGLGEGRIGAGVRGVRHPAAQGRRHCRANHSHSFDAGAAWVLAALQATASYHAHAMTGVKFEEAKRALPDGMPS
jgi:hypothetical protein